MENRRVLIVAGSDSSGGAGLEADQKVLGHYACYAMTATTALTVQNTQGVRNVFPIPSDIVCQQMQAVLDDIGADCVKIGMLSSAETVDAVAIVLAHYHVPRVVLDPVMVSTSGSSLLPDMAIKNLIEHLVPMSTLLTPNIPEARLLLGVANLDAPMTISNSVDDLVSLATKVHSLGCKAVLLKGGHMPLPAKPDVSGYEDRLTVFDVLYDGQTTTIYESDYVESRNTHGTGCSLASAVAAQFVLQPQADLANQIFAACLYIEAAIRTGRHLQLGKGHGPINHFHSDRENGVKMYKYPG